MLCLLTWQAKGFSTQPQVRHMSYQMTHLDSKCHATLLHYLSSNTPFTSFPKRYIYIYVVFWTGVGKQWSTTRLVYFVKHHGKPFTYFYRLNICLQTRIYILKTLLPIQETQVWPLSWEDPLEKAMATHSNIPAWRIPWSEEPGRLQSIGPQRVRQDWVTNTHTHTLVLETGIVKVVKSLNRVRLFATPWTVVHQAPPSMGFSRQE